MSYFMSIYDTRATDPLDRREWAPRARAEMVDMLIRDPAPEASAQLAVIAEFLCEQEELRSTIHEELATRPPLRPKWLARIGQTRIHRAIRVSHALDDVDTILMEGRIPAAGGDFTCAVSLGLGDVELVRDAGVLSETAEGVIALFDCPMSDLRREEIDPADARARLSKAISWDMYLPRPESTTWPLNRALVEWLIRALPDGGSIDPRPDLCGLDIPSLSARFLASPCGALFENSHRSLLESLIEFGREDAAGDPMRWNEARAERWLFEKVVEDADPWFPEGRESAPLLLRAFIRFAHDEVGIRSELTERVLRSIEDCESDFRERIRRKLAEGDDDWLGRAVGH
jgi:hypothetical protein